ncbi:MAG: hypothetical protein ACXVZV_04350 [Terriglobales bacterium]
MNSFVSEGLKIVLLAGAFAGIYGLSRWASRLNESKPGIAPPPHPEPFREPVQPPRQSPKIVPIDRFPQFHSSQPVDERELLPIRIVQMYFSQFDFDPGPPDPNSFADELFVKLYNADSGYDWRVSYLVATPDGLKEMLQRENWDYAFADSVFFVRRYDPKVIRQAVVEHLLSTTEKPSPSKEPEDRLV